MTVTMHEILSYFALLLAVRLGWKLREWHEDKVKKADAVVKTLEDV